MTEIHTIERKRERALIKLRRDLGSDVCNALEDPNTIEVMLNPDGMLWQERLKEPMRKIGTMLPARGEAIIKNVASYYDKVVTEKQTRVEEVLPIDGSRFAGQLPPIVSSPTFSIRKQAAEIIPLESYVKSGAMSPDQQKVIKQAVADHKNILVIGGTGSGKTTLTNAIISEMVKNDPNERPIIIEDTGEIQCAADNAVQYLTTMYDSMTDILRTTLRMRPDRIIVGEVRGAEALDLLDAWNTGHDGGIATIHANSTLLGLRRLKTCVSRSDNAPADIESYIGDVLQVVIHIQKDETVAAGRKINAIMMVHGFNGNEYITEEITS